MFFFRMLNPAYWLRCIVRATSPVTPRMMLEAQLKTAVEQRIKYRAEQEDVRYYVAMLDVRIARIEAEIKAIVETPEQ